MKPFIIVCCCLLASVVARQIKKISLEDIERDNLNSEKDIIAGPTPLPKSYGLVPMKTLGDYAKKEPSHKYYQSTYPFAHNEPRPFIAVPKYYEPPYQQYESLQYVTDNHIVPQNQQYYAQPIVYIQPYPSPSNAVESVVDPKADVQFVMYVPTVPKVEPTQPPSTPVLISSHQYSDVDVDDDDDEPLPDIMPQLIPFKRKPKSLLDSYIPSVLQIKYYKQHMAKVRANAIQQQTRKLPSPIPAKVEYVKTYRPQASTLTFRYQFPPKPHHHHHHHH